MDSSTIKGPNKLKRKNIVQKDQKGLPSFSVNPNLEIESDESSLDHQTSDQILQDIVRESKKSKSLRIECTEQGGEPSIEDKLLLGTSDQLVKTNVECDAPAIESPKKKKKIQRKTLSPLENSKNSAKETSSDSRRSTFDADLSIAIALSGGRGRRAAASKALEKTKDMYHNLPPLHEAPPKRKEDFSNTDLSDAKKLNQETKPKEEKSINVKNQKKLVHQKKTEETMVKLESEVIPLPVKSEPRDTNILKEKNINNYKIAFTGGHKDDRKPFESMIRKFGGTVVDSWHECTHLVTDKIRRTAKFLCALTTGKFIMDRMWLDTCKKEGKFVGEFFIRING